MSLITQLNDVMARRGYTQTHVARAIGRSNAVINQYLQGKYQGDMADIEERISAFVSREREKENNRYQDMKPQVEQLLKESLKLYYDMPDAASEYHKGYPEKWRKVVTGLKEFDKQIEKIDGNGLDPVYGSCVKMGAQLQDYWSDVIGSNKQFIERSRSLFIQDRMDCFDQFVFGKEHIEARKDLTIVNVWDK